MCFDIGIVTCGPNEAIVISGLFYGTEPGIIVGGRAIVCPCIQKVQRIPLSTQTLIIESPRVYTSQGVPISVTGVAQVNIIIMSRTLTLNRFYSFLISSLFDFHESQKFFIGKNQWTER